MKVIDFHSHIVPSRYPDRPPGVVEANWPSMEPIDDTHSKMVIAGRQFRIFESFYWNVGERIRRLDEEGIALQVISPLPELLSYWLAPDAAESITDFMNEFVAGMVAAAPERFAGMGSVALQDPARAVRQLAHLKDLGLRGVHIGSHVNGVSIADSRFLPFYEAAEALGLFLFVHGIKPGGAALMLGPPLMPAVVGVPQETAVAISSLIMTDILGRFPRLKFVFSHGGGTIASLMGRFQAVWKEFEPMRKALAMPPEDYLRRFYYDTVVFSPEYLSYLTKRFGATQLVAGTDGPVDFGQAQIPIQLSAAGIAAQDQELIAHQNAEALLAGNAAAPSRSTTGAESASVEGSRI
jgi:aminocarboxymuconate-semialdehyde decarboxylase